MEAKTATEDHGLSNSELLKLILAKHLKPKRRLFGIACQPRYFEPMVAAAHSRGEPFTPDTAWGVPVVKDPELLTPWQLFHSEENWNNYRRSLDA